MSTVRDRTGCRPGTILLVEDNPADAELAVIAIMQSRPDATVKVVETANEALAFLRRDGKHADAPVPDLVLLDLNLPGRSGVDVLEIIKLDDGFRAIPVIVFSNSNAQCDVEAAYRARANAYILKPIEYGEIKEVLGDLLRFWFSRACLPEPAPTSELSEQAAGDDGPGPSPPLGPRPAVRPRQAPSDVRGQGVRG